MCPGLSHLFVQVLIIYQYIFDRVSDKVVKLDFLETDDRLVVTVVTGY